MAGASGELFDRSAEVIGQRIALELERFHGQEVTHPLIETIQERVATSIGGLLGLRDAADMLGVSRQRALQLLDTEDHTIHGRRTPPPSPIARLRATPVWLTADIADFGSRRKTAIDREPVVLIAPKAPINTTHETDAVRTHRFSDITRRDDVLLREHFEDLALGSSIPARNFIGAFHKIVDGNKADSYDRLFEFRHEPGVTKYKYQCREPKPQFGAIVVKRAEHGIPPYGPYNIRGTRIADTEAKIIAEYAIKAGSVLDGLHTFKYENFSKAGKILQALQTLVLALSVQIKD